MDAPGKPQGKRRLAAIMFTDLKGYSALTHANEEKALHLLEEHRSIVRPVLGEFHGNEIKNIGDAFLVSFDSALNAVQCALQIQKKLHERNDSNKEEPKIELRIGIHLGDVVASPDGDIHGDGVNIAARLQSIASPGGIYISSSIFEQIHNKIGQKIINLGRKELKNISSPVTVYSVHTGLSEQAFPATKILSSSKRSRWMLPVAGILTLTLATGILMTQRPKQDSASSINALNSPMVEILAFENISKDVGDEYLSNGIAEELSYSLSKLPGIRVIARNKASAKGTLPLIGDLSARWSPEVQPNYIIRGSVQKIGERVRVRTQLLDSAQAKSVWSDEYNGEVDDFLDIQVKLADAITVKLKERGLASGAAAAGNAPKSASVSPEAERQAHQLYLKGRYHLAKRTEDGLIRSVDFFNQALKLNPTLCAAYASIANSAGLQAYYGILSPAEAAHLVLTHADKALALDPKQVDALLSLAETRAYYQLDWIGAEKAFKQAIEANPNHITARQWYAEYLAVRQRPAEAAKEISVALQLDPASLLVNTAAGEVDYLGKNYDSAIKRWEAVKARDPNFLLPYYWLGRGYVEVGKYSEAIVALSKALELSSHAPLVYSSLAYAYAVAGKQEEAKKILSILDNLAKKRFVSAYDIAAIYSGMNEESQAFEYLDKAFRERSVHLAQLLIDPRFTRLRSSSRFSTYQAALGAPH